MFFKIPAILEGSLHQPLFLQAGISFSMFYEVEALHYSIQTPRKAGYGHMAAPSRPLVPFILTCPEGY